MSLNAKRESILISEVPPGAHLFTIIQARMFAKKSGELILHEGNPGLILTISSELGNHQELYWINGFNYPKLLKLMKEIGIDTDKDIQRKALLKKKFWGVITETKTMRGTIEVGSEKRLTKTHTLTDHNPFKDEEYIIYKEETFNPEGPAF